MSKNKGKSKKGVFVLLLIIIGAAAAGIYFKFLRKPEEFAYAGTLEATKVDMSSQLASTIAKISVREGDEVAGGQELVTLTCEDVTIASRLATENYKRNLQLFKAGTVSQETLDQFKNRKDDTDLRLKWCTIASPLAGTVLTRYHEPGEWTSPGQKLMTLANIRDIWTYIYVPQPDVNKLSVGMKLKGALPEIADRTFEGTIVKINDEAEFTPKNVQTRSERTRLVYGVKISFLGSNDDRVLKPGMTIEMTLPKAKL